MLERLTGFGERTVALPNGQSTTVWQIIGVVGAAFAFVVIATLIVAFDSLLPGNDIVTLEVGDIATEDIRAPFNWGYESDVLTERERQLAIENTPPVFDPPDFNVARQQVQLAREILDYINNVQRDQFGTRAQRIEDIQAITALTLDDAISGAILDMSEEAWRAIDAEIISVLERVMRGEIREDDIPTVRLQLPVQVSVRFSGADLEIIVAIAEDLIRPNTFPNSDATEDAGVAAAERVDPISRVFERGQIVVREGTRIEAVDLEALAQFGLIDTGERGFPEVTRAFLASVILVIISGLFIARFSPELYDDLRFLMLLGALFLLVLLGARFFSGDDQIYIYPSAALALLLVALSGPEIAVIGMIGLAFLMGLMSANALETTWLVVVGGIIGALTLRRSERLDSYFLVGVLIALANTVVVTIFNLEALEGTEEASGFGLLLIYTLMSGIFSAAVALAGMYAVTLLFNLPTSLKLVELSQPSQPLLQRLLREAPGTYTHSLQVANLSEQAANTIGANAELVRVAALYHDIGKMLNPAFFVENQADQVNPHDVLNDPYRSADIIISHVTDGARLARQYRLPARIRDFISEHHGTTQVSYFYRQAVAQAGEDADEVDLDEFTYPGPVPQSRETAIMMLADNAESTVRARKPTSKQEISEIIQGIIDNRMREGQLDESGLTSSDIKAIRDIFVDMLQAIFHPRINYPAPTTRTTQEKPAENQLAVSAGTVETVTEEQSIVSATTDESSTPDKQLELQEDEYPAINLDDDTPMAEVPPLRRTAETATATDVDDVLLNPNPNHRDTPEANADSGAQSDKTDDPKNRNSK